jgi:ferritin
MYHHNLEKLKFLPIFITQHCNIMLNHAEKLTQYILTCDTASNTTHIETSLSINKNLINVLNAVNYYTCDARIYPHTLNPTPKEPQSSKL